MQNLHADLERCEPRVVSLLEAADWLRQANEMTLAPRSADQAAADSHARLSHLRARLTALTRMTANYASDLGAVLGYDTSDGCIRLHRVTCRGFFFLLLLSFSSDPSSEKPLRTEKSFLVFNRKPLTTTLRRPSSGRRISKSITTIVDVCSNDPRTKSTRPNGRQWQNFLFSTNGD